MKHSCMSHSATPSEYAGGTCVNRGLNWRYTHVKIAEEAFAADGGKRSGAWQFDRKGMERNG